MKQTLKYDIMLDVLYDDQIMFCLSESLESHEVCHKAGQARDFKFAFVVRLTKHD